MKLCEILHGAGADPYKDAAGVDDIGVPEFTAHLREHWPTIKAKLLAGTYIP